MPKWIIVVLIITLLIVLLIASVGCGSGDKGPVARISTDALVSAGTGTETGGGPGGPGGGGGNGACVIAGIQCLNNIDQTTCGQAQGIFNAGQTCQSLGFTSCQVFQGIEVCQ